VHHEWPPVLAIATLVLLTCTVSAAGADQQRRAESRDASTAAGAHDLSPAQMKRIEAIFAGAFAMGQGNPAIARHR